MDSGSDLIVPIVLCGGKGTRLWPLSRSSRPKQFLQLTSEKSLFQQTLLRLADPNRYGAPIVITNAEYRFVAAEQAGECGVALGAILLEPVARNTAAAIVAASLVARKGDEGVLVHVVPSDHEITVDDAYLAALDIGKTAARNGALVTFGITPAGPETGYGYIEAGEPEAGGVFRIKRFVEKPPAPQAEMMAASGRHYWNSGMFMFSAARFLAECETLAPTVFTAATAAVEAAKSDRDFVRLDRDAFAKSPDISVDYAVFEKTSVAVVVPAPIAWSDLGSWDAVWKASAHDKKGNVRRGPVSLSRTSSSLVVSEKLHIAIDGLDDIAVIASEDAVYVGRLSQAQNVGAIVKALGGDPLTRSLTESHQTCYRPWGGYASVLKGERFQVKRLFVKPGKRLSLQKHHHRSEHWVVVQGTAEVQVGDEIMILGENESAYIPQGAIHRLSNPGKTGLEVIEVQCGSYLGEDDIIRIEDEFGRA